LKETSLIGCFFLPKIQTESFNSPKPMKTNLSIFSIGLILTLTACNQKIKSEPVTTTHKDTTIAFQEQFRPQYHFTPPAHWMNDPNGLVYNQGVYHLFYQYYPEDIVWGPMHWGHAISKDLIHWEHKPIALYPDKNGYIFSGSAVVDKQNSSGFGSLENPPLVAIFTYHNDVREKVGGNDFQTQGIAYSLDNGDTWTVYDKNPVIGNKAIRDFRDPKVFWYEEGEQWILTLVAGDYARFYASGNLKDWKHLSDFGKNTGAHGGVWECPDLFKLKVENSNEEKWVLFISINPGAPLGGSGTQYFVGDFDGKTFTTDQGDIKWVDYGTDNYAGVTFNNTPDGKRIFIGWMSNWLYAQKTPTEVWRSAMTLPRELSLAKVGKQYVLKSTVVGQIASLAENQIEEATVRLPKTVESEIVSQAEISFSTANSSFKLVFSNAQYDSLALQYNANTNAFSIDRTLSGLNRFEENFGKEIHVIQTPNILGSNIEFKVFSDQSSIEVFINGGTYTFTEIVFPKKPFNKLEIFGDENKEIKNLSIKKMNTIW